MKYWESDIRYHRGCEEGAIGWHSGSISDATQVAIRRIRYAISVKSDCDSPIEVILGAAILTFFDRNQKPIALCRKEDIGRNHGCSLLIPQFRWSFYASDFAIFPLGGCPLLIECDGRDFHSSPAQKEHDYRKDLAAYKLGYPTLRFTGSEINTDPDACARIVALRANV